MKPEEFLYGSVFKVTREDTFPQIERNFRQMREYGLETVVVWPSSFFWEERTEEYPFHTGKEILRIAEQTGLRVIMELAGQLSVFEYIPDFQMKEEYYAVDVEGHREWGQPSFGFLNYFHPEVNRLITEHFRRTARAYRDSPALLGYDVFNETMFRSFDPWTMEEFRSWLREKYGTIERLNAVWERTCTDFAQVRYERHKWMSIMPEADYAAFRKEAVTRFLRNWCDAVRQEDKDHRIIADNIHSMVTLCGDYDRPQDDYRLRQAVDEIGMSFYPKGVGTLMEPAQRWQIFEGMFDASGREGFLISEMQTHIQALFNPDTAVRPCELKQWCMEGVAHGARGLIYWMWRPFRKGLQTLGRGLVDYRNRPTERLAAAEEIGRLIRETGQVTPVRAEAAIVYEDICEDFQRLYTQAYDVDQNLYLRSVYGAYRAMFDLNIGCDIVRLREIPGYRVVILTNHIVLDEADAALLRAYVEAGGILIIDGKFGICGRTSLAHQRLPGGPFYPMMGEDLTDSDYEGLTFTWTDAASGRIPVKGCYGRELVSVTDGEVLARFEDGYPAVVRRSAGRGTAGSTGCGPADHCNAGNHAGAVITVNTFLWYGYALTADETQAAFAKALLGDLGVRTKGSNPAVKLKAGTGPKGVVLFAFNYTDEEQETEYEDGQHRVTISVAPQEVEILLWGGMRERTDSGTEAGEKEA